MSAGRLMPFDFADCISSRGNRRGDRAEREAAPVDLWTAVDPSEAAALSLARRPQGPQALRRRQRPGSGFFWFGFSENTAIDRSERERACGLVDGHRSV